MNRYPLWKYVLIGVALLVGLVYTLPNFFGEVPAVQVSPVRATLKVDDGAARARRRHARARTSITPDGDVRRRDGRQGALRGHRDAVRARRTRCRRRWATITSSRSTCCRAIPQWLAAIGALPMYLGLDLRGGVHFLLQVDMKAALTKKMEAFTNDIRGALREKRIQYSGVARDGQSLVVRFRDARACATRRCPSSRRSLPDLELRTQDDARGVPHRRHAQARSAARARRTSRCSRTSRRCAIA